MDQDKFEVYKNTKNEWGQYPAILTKQAWPIKVYYMDKRWHYFTFAGTKQGIPSGQDRPILPTRVANQNMGFVTSHPLTDSAI